jgi:hypothetical protein
MELGAGAAGAARLRRCSAAVRLLQAIETNLCRRQHAGQLVERCGLKAQRQVLQRQMNHAATRTDGNRADFAVRKRDMPTGFGLGIVLQWFSPGFVITLRSGIFGA